MSRPPSNGGPAHPQGRRELVVAIMFRAMQELRSKASYPEPDYALIRVIEGRPEQFDRAVELANAVLDMVGFPAGKVGEERFDPTRRALSKQVGKRGTLSE